MGQPDTPRLKLLWGILLGISMSIGILVCALVALRLAPVSLFANQNVDSASVSGLAVLPPHYSADGLLQAAGNNVVSAASLSIEASRFDVAESRVIEITRQAGGFLEQFKVHRRSDATPWLEAALRLPARELNSALAAIGGLGLVKQETEATEDTGAEKESLSNQLRSERAELAHLNDVVQRRRGSLGDVVQAEEKLSARRSEINEGEKQLKKLDSRAEYALVEVQITERYQAHINWRAAGLSSDLRNASVEGLQVLLVSFAAVIGFLLHYGLLCLPWGAILYWPIRIISRRYRKFPTAPPAAAV
jgi:uncharacterized protein DUF4349